MSKQQQPNPSTTGAGETTDLSKPEQYGTFRLDALGASGTESMIEAPVKRRLPVQFVVLVVLVAVAGGALYAMRRLGMGPMGAVAEVKIEYDYDQSKGADHKKLLAELNTNHVDHQVPPDQVQKNPFKMPDLHQV